MLQLEPELQAFPPSGECRPAFRLSLDPSLGWLPCEFVSKLQPVDCWQRARDVASRHVRFVDYRS